MGADRPILAVDVDGVVCPFGEDVDAGGVAFRHELVDGMMRCVSLGAGDSLLRLSAHFDLLWASGWEERAGKWLNDILALPRMPHLRFGGAARFGSAGWKLAALEDYACGRPLAWVDDCIEARCRNWAEARPEPTLLLSTEPSRGLERSHEEQLLRWGAALRQ